MSQVFAAASMSNQEQPEETVELEEEDFAAEEEQYDPTGGVYTEEDF
jgi:hypothetical protein